MSVTQHSRKDNPLAQRGVLLTGLRVFALLSVLNVVLQGVSAGEVLMRNHTALTLHETGAIVIHVLAGITAVLAALIWFSTRRGLWSVVVATLVFIATFVQAAYGHGRTLYIHVPLAMLITVGAVWLLTWSWTGAGRPADAAAHGGR
ncbi:MAG TPA: hypothetical protein VGH99_19815 [Pseudonocardia sp.]|jgi:hypothetical protein